MGSLLVITGPPGAGKSAVASAVANERDPSVLLDGDAFFGFLDRGAITPWAVDAREQNEIVTMAAAAAAGRFAHDYFTVYDGMIAPHFVTSFAAAAHVDQIHYAVLLPPLDLCIYRISARRGHGFDDEAATRRMYREFEHAPIAARHLFTDSADGASRVAAAILTRFEEGSLSYTARQQ